MLRSGGPRPALLACGALLALGACARPGGAPAPDRLQRLLPGLGPIEELTLESETRPATRIAPGQTVRCRASVGPGSLLAFSLGIAEGAPEEGSVTLRVRADGRELAAETVPVTRRRWLNRSVRFDASGDVALEFRAEWDGPRTTAPFVALGAPRVTPPASGRRPRVLIWISQDTLRADHLGTYGYDRATSGNFDRLARGFTVFDRAVSAASWTLPSIASQMTSRYPSFHGATDATKAADPRSPTLFQILAANGFTVMGVTGNLFVSSKYDLARGFDVLQYTGLKADVVSRLARQYAEQWTGGDLALFVHYMDPHSPYKAPEPYRTAFDKDYAGEVDGYNYRSAAKTDADADHVRALYDGEILWTDHEIAGLFESLAQKGLLERAVIAYSSDHGEEFLDHRSWGHAHTLYEELLHVPLALRVPGAAPRRVATPVSTVDLAPTLLAALGVTPPASFQGRSLMPLVRGGALSGIPVFAETARVARLHKVAVRDGSWKYEADFTVGAGGGRDRTREALFDLAADPRELEAVTSGPDLERLRHEVEAFLARARAAGTASTPAALDAADQEELRALGYLN